MMNMIVAEVALETAVAIPTPSTVILSPRTNKRLSNTLSSPVAESTYSGVFESPFARKIAARKFVSETNGREIRKIVQ